MNGRERAVFALRDAVTRCMEADLDGWEVEQIVREEIDVVRREQKSSSEA